MLLVITEHNSWENERWKYLLDLDKQDGGALNDLMIFIRLANLKYDQAKKEATHIVFAASKYTFKFYNTIEENGRYPRLVNKNEKLSICSDPGYKSHSFDLNNKISAKKIKSALIAIRDKNHNVLYKSFDSLFLKKKTKTLAS